MSKKQTRADQLFAYASSKGEEGFTKEEASRDLMMSEQVLRRAVSDVRKRLADLSEGTIVGIPIRHLPENAGDPLFQGTRLGTEWQYRIVTDGEGVEFGPWYRFTLKLARGNAVAVLYAVKSLVTVAPKRSNVRQNLANLELDVETLVRRIDLMLT